MSQIFHIVFLSQIMMRKSSDTQQTEPVVYSRPVIAAALVINILLSIAIVLWNKMLFARYHVPNISLTCIHFIFTTVGMQLCRLFGVFTFKRLPLTDMFPISLTFCGFVVFTNLSLEYNTVGTYQIIKTLTTPFIISLQTFCYGRSFSTNVKLTLVSLTVKPCCLISSVFN